MPLASSGALNHRFDKRPAYVLKCSYFVKQLGEFKMSWKKNLPLMVFCLYLIKSSILPITFVEASILLVLGSMACYFEFKSNDSKLVELESNVKQVQTNLDIKSKELESLKSAVASMKLATGMRTLQNTQPR